MTADGTRPEHLTPPTAAQAVPADTAALPLTRARAMLRRHLSLGRYLLVGSFNTLLDIGLFTVQVALLGVAPLIANVVSTVVTMCVSYLLNRSFVFRSDRSHGKAFVPFVAVTLFSGLVVQSLVITGLVAVGGAVTDLPHELVATGAKVCAVGVGMVSNYLGYRFIFRGRNR